MNQVGIDPDSFELQWFNGVYWETIPEYKNMDWDTWMSMKYDIVKNYKTTKWRLIGHYIKIRSGDV